MRPVEEITAEEARPVRFVLTDIDDTLTRDGMLGEAAYRALWSLREAGLAVVPVTGRPAGWCDLIVREWPVEAVVGENGAFAFYRAEGRIAELTHPAVAGEAARSRLSALREAVLSEVPGSRVARDQFARLYDLAIDFREDPPYLGLDEARRIKAVCERFGAQARISSIHVNAWFGDYDKLSMVRLFLKERWGLDDEAARREALFCGDSPNDEPMFGFFPLACAVANIEPLLPLIAVKPAFVASLSHGEGFSEIVSVLLDRRLDAPRNREALPAKSRPRPPHGRG